MSVLYVGAYSRSLSNGAILQSCTASVTITHVYFFCDCFSRLSDGLHVLSHLDLCACYRRLRLLHRDCAAHRYYFL